MLSFIRTAGNFDLSVTLKLKGLLRRLCPAAHLIRQVSHAAQQELHTIKLRVQRDINLFSRPCQRDSDPTSVRVRLPCFLLSGSSREKT